ncbi:MAG: Rrf2 family transcriptional regulator [Chitinivibrionales bacterium]|nr:Rrf2 family transcriptional regulator [Chitinivibrionales bacterium]
MRLSTKCRYGTRAVVEIAQHYASGPIKRKEISTNQQISDSYLENILISLKNGGIIATVRGANGGYVLRRPAQQITLYEIVTILEGSLSPVECLENNNLCNRVQKCAPRMAWKKLFEAKEAVLRSITVQDLVDYEKTPLVMNFAI